MASRFALPEHEHSSTANGDRAKKKKLASTMVPVYKAPSKVFCCFSWMPSLLETWNFDYVMLYLHALLTPRTSWSVLIFLPLRAALSVDMGF